MKMNEPLFITLSDQSKLYLNLIYINIKILLFILTGNLFEGDIELSPDQRAAFEEQQSKNNVFASIKSRHWKTNGKADTIKYYIDPLIC